MHNNYFLQCENIKSLCSAPLKVAQNTCPQLIQDCEVLKDKYIPVFSLFARCHALYDKNYVENITDLGITSLMQTFVYIH